MTLAHHLLAHGWALARDVDRLLDAARRADVSPLGAGALAGSSLPLDPDGVADDLGFAAPLREQPRRRVRPRLRRRGLFVLALVGRAPLAASARSSCSGRATSSASSRLDDAYATGSSMMPQKKNPDIAELVRGKAGRLIGNLTGLLATLKGLPLAYNRDLQEDKEPLFDAVDQVVPGLSAMTGLLATDHASTPSAMQAAADTPVRRRPPTSPSSSCSRARPSATRTPSSVGSCRSPSSATCPWPTSWPPIRRSRGRSGAARARRVGRPAARARRRRSPAAVARQLERVPGPPRPPTGPPRR